MVGSKYTLKGRKLDQKASQFVLEFNQSAYESIFNGGFVRVFEEDVKTFTFVMPIKETIFYNPQFFLINF